MDKDKQDNKQQPEEMPENTIEQPVQEEVSAEDVSLQPRARRKKGKETKPLSPQQAKKRNRIYTAVMVLALAVLAVSVYMLITSGADYRAGKKEYNSVADDYVIPGELGLFTIDFDGLAAINSDIAGWIQIPDTIINYPIVQGKDNDYYLNHTFMKQYYKVGAIFMDANNTKDFSDKNTVIYGHHMQDGSMFASLTKYKEDSYYREHPNILLLLPDGRRIYAEIFTAFIVEADYEYRQMRFNSDTDFVNYCERMKSISLFDAHVNVGPKDRIITLSTCTYEYTDARFVVMARISETQWNTNRDPDMD
ncbi:class B sortase [Eubacteriales bacterium OttesenSCG-928-N14]|nr:class B sortase [Eubacteriales bacterium OttesenSCG-928-N14]